MPKVYTDTYLFRMYKEYEKGMFDFIMKSDRIDPNDKNFEDLLYDIKRRRLNESIIKVLLSDKVVLGYNQNTSGLPKALKVFTAKDVRYDNKVKVFIDLSDCIMYKNGIYVTNNPDWVVSYIINAMVCYIYNVAENKFTGNSSILKDGGTAFMNLFSYILDRIYKISSIPILKKKINYTIALYYQINILGKDTTKSIDSIRANAVKMSDVEIRDANMVDALLDDGWADNIDTYLKALSDIFKLKDLSLSIFIDKWMQSFGTGTVFGCEFFPAFSAMMTNTYIGGYIDQQLTIEKVTGNYLVQYTKTVLQIGSSVV